MTTTPDISREATGPEYFERLAKQTDALADVFAMQANELAAQEASSWSAALRAAAAQARQLPEGMRNCTILFKECKRGHGWLIATNWVQHGCPTCARESAESKLAKAQAEVAKLRRAVERKNQAMKWIKHWYVRDSHVKDDCPRCKLEEVIAYDGTDTGAPT